MTNEETSNPKNETIDSSSPHYIHASDSARQMQTNDPLTDNRYIDWVQEMANFLFAKNKMGFVDRTIPKLNEMDNTYMPWMRCDAMIKGWPMTSMEKIIRGSVKYANTLAKIWVDLKECFGKETAPRAYELKQKITIKRQGNNSVSAYYTTLRSLWDEISSVLTTPRCTCGRCTCEIGKRLNEFQEKEHLYEFLMGLDNEFSTIRTQVLSMKPNPTLREAYRRASKDEQQRSIVASKEIHVQHAAFQTHSRERCNNVNKQNNIGDKSGQKDSRQEHCTFCDRDGHKKQGCFKIIGYLDWWPGKTKNEKGKSKVAHVDSEASNIGALSNNQY
ncbi:uncharacterized protein LOC111880438 [Lactuca sativa]|uniref:uncharacterized protein LOC111880438 n=1 Tax=Lactuca sativa TaxID=4236 RepID=UPI000CD8068B|nr:uncharacterized protein LOC111880438 [Lactuca sativa]